MRWTIIAVLLAFHSKNVFAHPGNTRGYLFGGLLISWQQGVTTDEAQTYLAAAGGCSIGLAFLGPLLSLALPSDSAGMADLDDALDEETPEEARARDSEAEYTLEYPCVCPHCLHSLRAVSVVRLLRSKVNFTSTLPRRGRAVICSNCRKILTVELNTLT